MPDTTSVASWRVTSVTTAGARRVASMLASAAPAAGSTAVGNSPSARSVSRTARAETASSIPRRGRPAASTASKRKAGTAVAIPPALTAEAAQRRAQQELAGLPEHQIDQIVERARLQRLGLEIEDHRLEAIDVAQGHDDALGF